MPISIDLKPGSLESDRYGLGNDISRVVTSEFNDRLSTALASAIIEPEVDEDEIIHLLHKAIDQAAPKVFDACYENENRWEFGDKPLTELLGRLALRAQDVADLVPGEPYVADLHSQLDTFRDGIEYLKTLQSLWPPEIFRYFSALNTVTRSKDLDSGDAALDLVGIMAKDVEHTTLDPDHPEGLLLITHLPGHVRQLTRQLLVGNHVVARIESALGESVTPEEKELLRTLRRYYSLDSLHGQQWESESLPLSEEGQVQIARYSAEQLATLALLQQKADETSGDRFKEVWLHETEQLKEITKAADQQSKTQQWQLTDTGHAFEGFRSWDLLKAFRYGPYSWEDDAKDFTPNKTGLRAVILEDNDSQRSLWEETVQNSTSFSVEDSLSFASPDGIDEVIDDPTIGLFLLDIQNGEDLTAGIRVGEKVLRQRYENMISDPAGNLSKTKIIIWSASIESVEQAEAHFRPIIQESMPGVGYHIGSRSGGRSSNLVIEVRPKTWHSYSDIE